MYNLPVDQMHAPVVGPSHHSQKGPVGAVRNHRAGHVEDANLGSYAFDEQYNQFQARGVAADPSGGGMVRHRDLVKAGARAGGPAAGPAGRRGWLLQPAAAALPPLCGPPTPSRCPCLSLTALHPAPPPPPTRQGRV